MSLEEDCRDDLGAFATLMSPWFEYPEHLQRLGAELEAVERGENTRLMITFPPRHGKSVLVSQMFPAWYLGRHPEHQIVVASYAATLAKKFGRTVRNTMQNPLYKAVFSTEISKDSRAKDVFDTTAGGAAVFVGVGGALTGKGAHIGIIDDPIKGSKEADSEITTETLRDWYREVFYTRLMPGNSAIIVVSTRWRHNDLQGWLLNEQEQEEVEDWRIVDFPAIATSDSDWRKEGEALWADKYPVEKLKRIRTALGTRKFEALYQQRPSLGEGAIFNLEWVRQVDRALYDDVIMSVIFFDTAVKEEEINDYTAWCHASLLQSGSYVVHHIGRMRAQTPEVMAKIEGLYAARRPQAIAIEDAVNGSVIVQFFKSFTRQAQNRLPIIPIKPHGSSKTAKANSVTPLLESGLVVFEKPVPPEFLSELAGFPLGEHDDMVDAMVGALRYLSGQSDRLDMQQKRQASVSRLNIMAR